MTTYRFTISAARYDATISKRSFSSTSRYGNNGAETGLPGSRWSDEEVRQLRDLRDKGYKARASAEMAFPGRGLKAVENKLIQYYESKSSIRQQWTQEEQNRLMSLRAKGMRIHDIVRQEFPSKTIQSAQSEVQKISTRERRRMLEERTLWTQNERQHMREMSTMGCTPPEIAKRLGRSPVAVVRKAHLIGLRLPHTPRSRRNLSWTKEEDDVLKPYLPMINNVHELQSLLPERTFSATENRMQRLRKAANLVRPSRSWTQDDRNKLGDYRRQGLSLAEIGDRLGRSRDSIKARLYEIRIQSGLAPTPTESGLKETVAPSGHSESEVEVQGSIGASSGSSTPSAKE